MVGKSLTPTYASNNLACIAQHLQEVTIDKLENIRHKFSGIFVDYKINIECVFCDSPFRGLGHFQRHDQHLAVVLIASRIQGTKITAKQKDIVEEYPDALVVSTSRGSGLIVPLDESIDMAPYHTQMQTIENHVKPGDVLELYHLAMYLVEGKVGISELMKKSNYNIPAAEQIFRAHLHEIRRKGTLQLSKALGHYGNVRPYALRELICGLGQSRMNIIPNTSPKWIEMQLKTDLNCKVLQPSDGIEGSCVIDAAVCADGMLATSDGLVKGKLGVYTFQVDSLHVIHFDSKGERGSNKRTRYSNLEGLLA